MDQKFGEFVREKRIERGLKLKKFAELVGISSVYESYIENGQRPAPSQAVLQKVEIVLDLDDNEIAQLYSLAVLSRDKNSFPVDLIDYISCRPYVINALRIAIETNAGREEWDAFSRLLGSRRNTTITIDKKE